MAMISGQKDRESAGNSAQFTNLQDSIDISAIKINIITNSENLDELKRDWNELVKDSNASIFQTFEWNKTWWKYFGAGKELYVFTVHEKKTLIGILPLFIDTVTLAGLELYSCLRFVGSTVSNPEGENLKGLLPYSDYLDVIVRPGYENIFFQLFIRHIKKTKLAYHQIIMEEIPHCSSIVNHMVPLLQENDIAYNVSEGSVCAAIKLESTWNSYLENLSKRTRYNARKFVKKAEHDEFQVFEVDRVRDLNNMFDAYEKLVSLHQERWNAEGYPGVFAEQRFYEFLKEVTILFIKKGWAELQIARSIEDGKLIAVDLLFKFKNTIYLMQRAFDIRSELNTHSPGNVLLYHRVRDAIDEKYQLLDFMRGEDPYKYRSANNFRQNNVVTIINPNKSYFFRVKLYYVTSSVKQHFIFEKEIIKTVFHRRGFFSGMAAYFRFMKGRISDNFFQALTVSKPTTTE